MALFDIFGDHLNLTRQTKKNVSRQPLTNIESCIVEHLKMLRYRSEMYVEGILEDLCGVENIAGCKFKIRTVPHRFTFCENMGKMVTPGPIKPNEPVKSMKKGGETKKSFLSNTGKALQSTPRAAFTPRAKNVVPYIYNDETNTVEKGYTFEELEFTKPAYKNDNYHRDALDFLSMPELQITKHVSPPNTPPPIIARHSMDLDCSYQDEFFTDDFSNDSIPDDDLGLPELY